MRRFAIVMVATLLCGPVVVSFDANGDRAEAGRRLFAGACAACHGNDGRGDGPAAHDLVPAPRDLTTRQFRFRTTATGELPRPDDLKRTIREGLPGTAMPGFGKLFSSDELDALAAFVYSLHGDPEPPPAMELVRDGTLDDGSVDEGRAVYLISGCWTCHGIDGDGRGPSSATLTDENDLPLGILDLRYDPFKGGRELGDVIRALRTGLNGAPMPSYDEAMLFAAEDYPLESLPLDRFRPSGRDLLAGYLESIPTRTQIDAGSREALRDRRIEALARYLLSLDRRRGFAYRLFREDPERAARQP